MAACLITWWMDLSGVVSVCPYCRVQRTAIGLVGLFLIIDSPILHGLLSSYCICLGFKVSLAHVFMHLAKGSFPNTFSYYALAASYGFLLATTIIGSRGWFKLKEDGSM